MNTNRLVRLDDRLTVWERIPLLLAANGRGDEAECRRLIDTSPPRAWHFPEYLLAEQAVHVLTMTSVAEQLDAALSHFFALFPMTNDAHPDDWALSADATAYYFTKNAEAWKRFCADLDIVPQVLTSANYRGWLLHYCEGRRPANAPSVEVLQALLRKEGRDATHLVTTESLLVGWREALRAMTRQAPPPNVKEVP
jgi:hypothetical protein